jgi:metal-dependent hydrolase (beta-lactamase superfamily II)
MRLAPDRDAGHAEILWRGLTVTLVALEPVPVLLHPDFWTRRRIASPPQLVVPAHCTSWLAHHALYDAMPQAYRPNSAGSRVELRAAAETKVS